MKKYLFYGIGCILWYSCTPKKQDIEIFKDQATALYGVQQGNTIITKPEYLFIDEFTSCGIATATHSSGAFHYLTSKGTRLPILPLIHGYLPDKFQEGYARFKKDHKVGFINECGEISIPATFEFAMPFMNGVSIVAKDFKMISLTPEHQKMEGGVYGIIDTTGRMIVPYTFDYIQPFESNKKQTIAKKDGKQFLINTKGERIPTDTISP